MSPITDEIFYQRNLPHFHPPGATIFITFRLAGSLPYAILKRLNRELLIAKNNLNNNTDVGVKNQIKINLQKRLFKKFDEALDDTKNDPKWLAEPKIAQLVCEKVESMDSLYYRLDSYCVMPNHVHMVCTPINEHGEKFSLSKIMHLLKGSTAFHANQILNRRGCFWQHESYDHVVRNNKEFLRIVNYVIENPIRAGLTAMYVYCRPGIF